jgi:hypothetical protein
MSSSVRMKPPSAWLLLLLLLLPLLLTLPVLTLT